MKKILITMLLIARLFPVLGQNMEVIEYFFDNDPGYGSGISIPITSASNISNLSFNVDISNLNTGLHILYVRSKNSVGEWSLTNQSHFYKYPSPYIESLNNITDAEYFIDTDPGFGLATSLPLTQGVTIYSLPFIVSTSGLSVGLHTLYVRTKGNNGLWSLTNRRHLYKYPSEDNTAVSNMNQVEYFLDADPGFGNGISLPITSASDIASLNCTIDSTNLNGGTHVLQVRSKGDNNEWSLTNRILFTRNHFKLFLQGYYDNMAHAMSPVLFNQGQLNDTLVTDTVEIEVRNEIYPYEVQEKSKALLKGDGTVFSTILNAYGSKFLAINHRNSVSTWSSQPVSLGAHPMTYDFSTSLNQAYGSNQIEVDSNTWAFYSGDINQDGVIDAFDYITLDPDVISGASGYLTTDLTGDGIVDAFDYILLDANLIAGLGVIMP
jgi:hypothetical protein